MKENEPAGSNMNIEYFTSNEITKKLRKCENTAPGPDGITYNHIKKVDPYAKVLTPLYNLCLRFQAVPEAWKRTTTILIYKKGDKEDPGNWRPIALGNTIYKLYVSCLNVRLYKWISDNDVLSFNQKGFLPHDGVFENNYVLDQVLRKFKNKHKDIFMASLDITNAFGSLPHWVIFEALRLAGAGEGFINIVKDLYSNATTSYRTSAGSSTPRVAATGVKQGDPLSGVLFIIAIDFLLRRIQREGSCRDPSSRNLFHYILSYADDMLVLAKDAAAL